MLVKVFDYGAGNLHSLVKALGVAGAGRDAVIEPDPLELLHADVLVLPGVGNFAQAAARLAPGRDLVRLAIEGGLPTLGICLGMQLLFESSEEGAAGGQDRGLGVFRGRVRRLRSARVPHMGWNSWWRGDHEELAYFAHSFVCEPADRNIIVSHTRHEGERFVSAVRRDMVFGVQFHPEKSGARGVGVLRDFLAEVRARPRGYAGTAGKTANAGTVFFADTPAGQGRYSSSAIPAELTSDPQSREDGYSSSPITTDGQTPRENFRGQTAGENVRVVFNPIGRPHCS